MTSKLPMILAISPRSTRLGLAVFQGEYLQYYTLISLWPQTTANLKKVGIRIESIVKTYAFSVIAIEKLIYPAQKTGYIVRLTEIVGKIVADNSLQIISYSPDEVNRYFVQERKRSNARLACALAQYYPELMQHVSNQTRRQQIYWMPVFKAIALGLFFAQGDFKKLVD